MNSLKNQFFKKENFSWVDELSNVLNEFINNTHSATKMTPIEKSEKFYEYEVYNNMRDKRKKESQKLQWEI